MAKSELFLSPRDSPMLRLLDECGRRVFFYHEKLSVEREAAKQEVQGTKRELILETNEHPGPPVVPFYPFFGGGFPY